MKLIWHGHSTWQVTVGNTVLMIDPFFDNPKTSTDPDVISSPDYLLLTHGHTDHVGDVETFAQSSTVVGSPEITSWVGSAFGAGETIGMNFGGTVECGDAYVSMVQAYHTNSIEMDPEREVGLPAGYVISDSHPTQSAADDSTTFYHAGDTSLMSEMRDIIGPFLAPDAAAVPIGDHYTMGPHQAAIAIDWLEVDHAFPMHYDTFPLIEQDPAEFADEVQANEHAASVHILEADEPFDLP